MEVFKPLNIFERTTSKGFSERLDTRDTRRKTIIGNRAVIVNITTSSLFLQMDFL